MFCQTLYICYNYEEKERGALSDIGKDNEQLPHILYNWPRSVIWGASQYGTLMETCTCTCPELPSRGPWYKHLLLAVIKQNMLPEIVYITLDRLLGSYKNCTIKQSDLDAITNPFSRDKFL